VFTGTSGGLVCSAFAPTAAFEVDKLIVDQTLNWAPVETEEQAVYLSGLLNSEAINEKIESFQPKGGFGKRHIHSLPFAVTPRYDGDDPVHQEVVKQTRQLLEEYELPKSADEKLRRMLDPNRGTLAIRRKFIKTIIKGLPSYDKYARACKTLYEGEQMMEN